MSSAKLIQNVPLDINLRAAPLERQKEGHVLVYAHGFEDFDPRRVTLEGFSMLNFARIEIEDGGLTLVHLLGEFPEGEHNPERTCFTMTAGAFVKILAAFAKARPAD